MPPLTHALGDALSCKLGAIVKLEGDGHLESELDDLRPVWIVGVEVVGGPLHPDDARANMRRERVGPWPVLRIAYRQRLDRIRDEVGDRLEDSIRGRERVYASALLVEHLLGPSSESLGAKGEIPVKRLQEPWIFTSDVSDNLVRMGRHETCGVYDHAVKPRGIAEAVPIALLDLSGFVGIEQEVSARGAPRQSESRARIDDARSGHAEGSKARMMPNSCLVFPRTSRAHSGG